MTLETKLFLIKDMLEDEDENLNKLSELSGEDLMDLASVADKITEQISVVITANSMLAGDING